MPHIFSIAVVSKAEGDFETEDEMMSRIQEFSVKLKEEYEERASVMVNKKFGIDPNDFGGPPKKEAKRTASAGGGNIKEVSE